MANVVRAQELAQRALALHAQRYNVDISALESPLKNLLVELITALDEPDPTPPVQSEPEPETRVETPKTRRNK